MIPVLHSNSRNVVGSSWTWCTNLLQTINTSLHSHYLFTTSFRFSKRPYQASRTSIPCARRLEFPTSCQTVYLSRPCSSLHVRGFFYHVLAVPYMSDWVLITSLQFPTCRTVFLSHPCSSLHVRMCSYHVLAVPYMSEYVLIMSLQFPTCLNVFLSRPCSSLHVLCKFLPHLQCLPCFINFVIIDSTAQAIACALSISKLIYELRSTLATPPSVIPKLTWCTGCPCAISHNVVGCALAISYEKRI